ncbi:MAG TPA: hypothetical protein DCP84_16100 [Pseudomonas sp.]|nr:hypothetical protein [Pseudomonas sp.]
MFVLAQPTFASSEDHALVTLPNLSIMAKEQLFRQLVVCELVKSYLHLFQSGLPVQKVYQFRMGWELHQTRRMFSSPWRGKPMLEIGILAFFGWQL